MAGRMSGIAAERGRRWWGGSGLNGLHARMGRVDGWMGVEKRVSGWAGTLPSESLLARLRRGGRGGEGRGEELAVVVMEEERGWGGGEDDEEERLGKRESGGAGRRCEGVYVSEEGKKVMHVPDTAQGRERWGRPRLWRWREKERVRV